MDEILGNIPKCLAIADDVILFATSFDAMYDTLDRVLNRFLGCGITLNKQKCELFINKVEFFGFVFTSQTKIESIQNMPPPTNISELRSFLGMPNYLSRFIPNYFMRIYLLLELTKKNIPWLWTHKHQTIFDDLKTELISPKVMSYYDLSLNSLIITDASPIGISAILLQQSSDSSYRIIAYSSGTLTPTEQNCSQLEQECLTIVHARGKFRVYILGGHFEIIKDHKPLVHLFKSAQSRMPLRIERWILLLQEFDFTISHIKGTVNPANFLSRHPFDIKTKTDIITEQYVNFIQNHVCPEAISLQEIRDKTKNDITLQKVFSKKQNKREEINIENKELKILLNLIPELTLTPDGILLKQNRIVIPNELQYSYRIGA